MAKFIVTVTSHETGAVILRRNVDLDAIEIDSQLARAAEYEQADGTSQAEWDARVAAYLVGAVEVCPFDCDHCRAD